MGAAPLLGVGLPVPDPHPQINCLRVTSAARLSNAERLQLLSCLVSRISRALRVFKWGLCQQVEMRAPEPEPSDRNSSVAGFPEVRVAAAAQCLV